MWEYDGYYFEALQSDQERIDFGLFFQTVFVKGLIYSVDYSLLNSMRLVETSIVIVFDTEVDIPKDAML